MPNKNALTIEQYKDLLTRIVATYDNLLEAEKAGDRTTVEKLRTGLGRVIERAREAARPEA